MLKSNPLFEEMERRERMEGGARQSGGVGVQEEGDSRKGVLFVNPSAVEETGEGGREDEKKEQVEEVGKKQEEEEVEEEEEDEREEEDEVEEEEDDDFILEPPEDFSQSSVEREDETGLVVPTNAASSSPYAAESHYTSIDNFDPDSQGSQESLEEHPPTDPDPTPFSHHLQGGRHIMHHGGGGNTGARGGGALNGERAQKTGSVASYYSEREIQAVAAATARDNEIDEEEFDDEIDSRYRRPTGRIPGTKRVPSWGRSDQRSALEEDDLPSVVYEDDVAALIW